jgi:hypothetical protein
MYKNKQNWNNLLILKNNIKETLAVLTKLKLRHIFKIRYFDWWKRILIIGIIDRVVKICKTNITNYIIRYCPYLMLNKKYFEL